MGGGASKRVSQEHKCPEGFDKQQFAHILRYYDKLDSDGNNVLTEDEYLHLAQIHTKRVLDNIIIKSKGQHIAYNIKKQRLSHDMEIEKKHVEQYYSRKINELDAVYDDQVYEYTKLIEHYTNMKDEQKVQMLQSTLGDKIDFWEFFQIVQNIDFQTIKYHQLRGAAPVFDSDDISVCSDELAESEHDHIIQED